MNYLAAPRTHALRMVHAANSSHIGTCLSMADILGVLYARIMNIKPDQPEWPERDRLIISKGHTAAIVYAMLAERGFFPTTWLDTYCKNGTRLAGHVTHYQVPGVEFSSGSLGHGLSLGCGVAWGAKADHAEYRTFVVLSDGECDEGSIWEGALLPRITSSTISRSSWTTTKSSLSAASKKCLIWNLSPINGNPFGWSVKEIDGHDHAAVFDALFGRPMGKRPAVGRARSHHQGQRRELHGKQIDVALQIAGCGAT